MRRSRKVAQATTLRIIAKNYNISWPEEEDEKLELAEKTIGKDALTTIVDEIETAIREYAYRAQSGI